MCLNLPFGTICNKLFGSCHKGNNRCGKRPESFLTPYEMEMVPLMLKELDDVNSRFYQMVCYRWFQEASLLNSPTNNCKEARSVSPLTPNSKGNLSFEEFLTEGQNLKQLIRFLSRALMEKGTFDSVCESRLAAYRVKCHHWRSRSKSPEPYNVVADNLSRTRSFSAAVASAPMPSVTHVLNSAGSSSTTTSASIFSASTLSPSTCLANAPSTSCTTILSQDISAIIPEEDHETDTENEQNCKPRRSFLRSNTWIDNRRRRAESMKERQTLTYSSDALFVQLGEILAHQFHSTITTAEQNPHDRELKVLIWRHFIQMLVAVLTDRARFPV
ncbi:hypothetical protein Ddc_03966 [Ditylenchus destructor]|nr:hypothetical protein Ddc_03966 [Ditylenchus destructor]